MVRRLDAPGAKCWALYQWARTDAKTRREFFGVWATANKRSTEQDGEAMAEEVRRQTSEMEAMLAELRVAGD